jgi:hypothetical protein
MIIFDGIQKAKEKSNVSFVKFKNEKGGSVSIPLPNEIVNMISTYLNLLNNEVISNEEDNRSV